MSNEQIKARLKSYFQSGDVPTESQFGEFIDEAITSDASRLTEGKLAIDRLPKALDLNTVSGEGEATLAAKNVRADALEVNALNTRDITSTTMNATTLNSRDVITTTVQSDSANLTTLQSASVSATDIATGTLNADSFITDNISVGGAITAVSVEAKLKGDGAEIQNLNPDAITGKVKSEKLYKGTKSALGVMQFATQEDIDSGADNRAVTPKSMNQSIQHSVSQSETNTRTELRSELSQSETELRSELSQSETELRSELSQSETRTDGKIQEVAAESKAYTETHIQTLRTDSEDYTNGKIQTATDQNKAYIDGEIALLQAGIKFKKGVATVISEPLDLASGAPFPEVDGYQIVEGDRVLFTQQDDPKQNRVYMASSENKWLLAEDFDALPTLEIFIGLSVEVMAGSALQNSIWTIIALEGDEKNPSVTWQKRNDINQYHAGNGIDIDHLKISIKPDHIKNIATEIVDRGIPMGAILMWHGVEIPAGWALCNGENGTPDLRDRFIVGAGNSYLVSAVGGEASIKLTAAESGMPNHTASGSTSSDGHHSHPYADRHYFDSGSSDNYGTGAGDDVGHLTSTSARTGSDGDHSHQFSINVAGENASQPHENRPPYYALSYIMRIA